MFEFCRTELLQKTIWGSRKYKIIVTLGGIKSTPPVKTHWYVWQQIADFGHWEGCVRLFVLSDKANWQHVAWTKRTYTYSSVLRQIKEITTPTINTYYLNVQEMHKKTLCVFSVLHRHTNNAFLRQGMKSNLPCLFGLSSDTTNVPCFQPRPHSRRTASGSKYLAGNVGGRAGPGKLYEK